PIATARSAAATCGARRSASEYTAMVSMSSSRQARIIRSAISPRFAMSRRRITERSTGEAASLLAPCGLALFEKRLQPFLSFRRHATRRDRARGDRHRLADRTGPYVRDERLGGGNALGSGREDFADVLRDGHIEVGSRHHR